MDRYTGSTERPTLHTPERKEEGTPPQSSPASAVAQRRAQGGASSRFEKKPTQKMLFGVIGLVLLLVLGWWLVLGRNGGVPSYIETSKYQAVFLQSGESYFGKVTSVSPDTILLTNVFYVQKSTQVDTDKTASGDKLELIKLGNEVHGPEDKMILSRSQVLYVENLKDDGQVVQKIQEYNQQNNK